MDLKPTQQVNLSRQPWLSRQRIIHRRRFEYRGLTVDEVLLEKEGEPGKYKLMWARAPLEAPLLPPFPPGVENPICHGDFDLSWLAHLPTTMYQARRYVQEAFHAYWVVGSVNPQDFWKDPTFEYLPPLSGI